MTKQELTELEHATYKELIDAGGKIDWVDTEGQQSAALKRLVKKGWVVYDNGGCYTVAHQ